MSKITFVLEWTFPIHEMLTQGYFEELITLLRWIPQRVIDKKDPGLLNHWLLQRMKQLRQMTKGWGEVVWKIR
jgi:hypothetical protein